jgi:hypothetical protein
MASIITATNSSGLTTSADNSGVLQLASGTGNLVTVPSVTGTAMVSGNMPAFSAYASGSQSLSSLTLTKIQFNTEEFDTANCYDNSTNYRFTPNVAGYYQISMTAGIGSTGSAVANTQLTGCIYKNGSIAKFGGQTLLNNTYDMLCTVSTLIYLNGSTDYVEGYLRQISGGSLSSAAGQTVCYFQGALVRSA